MTRGFKERLDQAWPACTWKSVPVVVAVSGGADSVALLRALVALASQAESTLVAAHFNHCLRPDSERDAEFVSDLCAKLQLSCKVGTASQELAAEAGGSLEDAARNARYTFLVTVAREVGARYIATAHTADDQAETILHRIVRGTGIRGLGGIPFSRELMPGITLVRPILDIQRTEVIDYLTDLGQAFRHDATNSDDRFTRNKIRNVLLPMLRHDFNPHVDQSLRQLGTLASEMTQYVESVASERLSESVCFTENAASIKLEQLTGVKPLIVRTMLRQIWRTQGWPERDMTFERWRELEELMGISIATAESVIRTLPANLRVEREATSLTIEKQGQP